ncbi:hypothetical protein SLEP1_g27333 [Rubroshorea leprosula]|uniref:LisH domain-containing protein n=1 Tax=Rubroshorea leprosula TaxID=152421 RepID=A0AAV5K0U7_9ROSI|nr:hypothetical protein SLEP1_g27333 [Rubroshorea leprosula]
MDVERSSLCNCVVNFLLEENYLLTAFELLHELLDDGRDAQAIRLKEFFSDPSHFPLDQISRFNSLQVVDPQNLLEEKEAAEEKLAISEYELRLAQEDIVKLKAELQRKADLPLDKLSGSDSGISANLGPEIQRQKRDAPFSDLGPLKPNERRDLNCAVKDYLLIAGYRLTAMTFYEEVTDQNLDVWQSSPACVPDALRHYYYQYLSSTTEAAEEKIAMLQENELLRKANESLQHERQSMLKSKDLADGQISALTKAVEAKELMVQDLKQALEFQRKELNGCRAEITSLKMHIEGSLSGRNLVNTDVESVQSQDLESYREEIKSLQMEIEILKANNKDAPPSVGSIHSEKDSIVQTEEKVVEVDGDKTVISHPVDLAGVADNKDAQSLFKQTSGDNFDKPHEISQQLLNSSLHVSDVLSNVENISKRDEEPKSDESGLHLKSENRSVVAAPEKRGLGTIQILADALPKIVPYVLINHREELLPLIMCAIERHPDGSMRDSLTHTLFNLIKRPDEQQRRIIMDVGMCYPC